MKISSKCPTSAIASPHVKYVKGCKAKSTCRTRTPIRQGGYSRQERPQLYTWIHHLRKRTGGRLQGRVTGEAEVREYGLHSLPSCGVSEAAGVPNHLTKRHYGWWSDQVMTTYLRKHCPAWRLCRGRCSQCERVFGCILHPLLCFVCFALLAPGTLPAVGVLVALGSLGLEGSVMNYCCLPDEVISSSTALAWELRLPVGPTRPRLWVRKAMHSQYTALPQQKSQLWPAANA